MTDAVSRTVVAVVLIGLVSGCGGGSTETVTVTKRRTATVTKTVTKTVTEAAPSTADEATNLVVTPKVRHLVRLAVIQGKSPTEAKQIEGPLEGMYYGEYRGVRYALASFDRPLTGTTDEPSLYVQLPHQPWFMWVTEVGNGPIEEAQVIPCPLRKVWHFGCAEEAPSSEGSQGYPEFNGALGSVDEIEEFDQFIREHEGERVRVSVTFPNRGTFRTDDEKGSTRSFLLGDVACEPFETTFCEHRYWYRILGVRSNDYETVFGWGSVGDAGNGYFLRGIYVVAGWGTGTGGIQWRALQAKHSSS
jgi:hypothetical protein